MDFVQLQRIADTVGERRGWSFAQMRAASNPEPWDYEEVVRRYLRPSSQVLDIGTGGGERFLSLAPFFARGVGTDLSPTMVAVARENTTPEVAGKVSFAVMPADDLHVPDSSFDVVLNRHSAVHVDEIVRVLRPGGFFITQQPGVRNTQNICAILGYDPTGEYPTTDETLAAFAAQGCDIVARAEYDIRYWFLDVESLLFWLKAVPVPPDFALDRYWRQVNRILVECQTPNGIETNEQRELFIVRKHDEVGAHGPA